MVQRRHDKHWPSQFPKTLELPKRSIFDNLVVSAQKAPNKPAIIFYNNTLDYSTLLDHVKRLGQFLINECKVSRGDRVILDMQSCPQFIIGYYAVLSVGGVIVPVNPMNVSQEIEHYCTDSRAKVAIVSQDLVSEFTSSLHDSCLETVIAATYSDFVDQEHEGHLPKEMIESPINFNDKNIVAWGQTQETQKINFDIKISPSDLAAILYTSGTTGKPKGCMHSHETIMHTTVGGAIWEDMTDDSVCLATAPMFHVTGMQHSMNACIYAAASIVILPRWNPQVAGHLIETHRCTHWANVPTMVTDLLADPSVTERDLSSLKNIFGGGSSMPEAVAQKLFERCKVRYMEGYGMTEAISQTHQNPPQELRKQCLGIPIFDTDSTVIDPDTLSELGPNKTGEIVSSGPQIMLGYWEHEKANQEAFIDIDGVRFFRTGDLGWCDDDGFFYITDRIKRMINAAGYKVWPAEIESTLYKHPEIKEVTVISSPDKRRGETVKAVIVLKEPRRESVTENDITTWSRKHMASYKIPRKVSFVDELPKSGSGKIQWRALQEKEWGK